jgi:hypothetical protein
MGLRPEGFVVHVFYFAIVLSVYSVRFESRYCHRTSMVRCHTSPFLFIPIVQANRAYCPTCLYTPGYLRAAAGELERQLALLGERENAFFLVERRHRDRSKLSAPGAQISDVVSDLTLTGKLLFPFYAMMFYPGRVFWPANLAPLYPAGEWGTMLASFILFLTVTAFCIFMFVRRHRVWLLVWLSYLLTLMPVVIGLSAGIQPIADRYSYLSTIGFLPSCWWSGAYVMGAA